MVMSEEDPIELPTPISEQMLENRAVAKINQQGSVALFDHPNVAGVGPLDKDWGARRSRLVKEPAWRMETVKKSRAGQQCR